ncbi:MAG TPA: hypothetical protein VEA18_00140, partial [Candidatus Kapabacteria bacterium]|nr:hypothetical protein [Candidatus Kapabacteria bacterium]
MERKEVHYQGLALEYREKGENPSWLIYSGTHGDEAGVISSIETVLSSEEKNFPSFLWVPMVSPSAVANGTRNNARGVNVNRDFFDHSTEPEVQANISLIRGKVFEYFIDIHEDPSTELFYLYDSWNIPDNPMMQHLFRTIQNTGVGLYDGIDDPDD